jgi:hypothetical protein
MLDMNHETNTPQTYEDAAKIRKDIASHDDTNEIIGDMYDDIDNSTRTAMDSGVSVPKLMEPSEIEDPDQPTRQNRLKNLAGVATGAILIATGAENIANQIDKDLEIENNFKSKSAEVTDALDVVEALPQNPSDMTITVDKQDFGTNIPGIQLHESEADVDPMQPDIQSPDLKGGPEPGSPEANDASDQLNGGETQEKG